MKLSALFKPIAINQVTVKNRLVVPPMVTNYGDENGNVTDRTIAYLEERAKGGWGLIILEATAVSPEGRGFPKQPCLFSDSQIPALQRLAQAIHRHGAKLAVQLYHAGRQTYAALLGGPPVAPSGLPCPVCRDIPQELQPHDIERLVHDFGEAARRSREAGVDAVEIHGAHGYLINQFVSPYSNRRTDGYGGTMSGRLRFPLMVIKAVRRAVGADFPIIYRLSARERVPGGLEIEDTLSIAPYLVEAGVDAFHVSTGVYESMPYIVPPFSLPEGLNVADASRLKATVEVPVIVAGRIPDPAFAEQVVASGRSDLVAMGRASIVDPYLPLKAAAGDLEDIRPCISCNQKCIGGLNGPEMTCSCVVNPAVGREREWRIEKTRTRKRVLVVGGGPAGLEAARVLAERGHQVVLVEKTERFGGQFRLAALPPEKQPLAKLIAWQVRACQKAGVNMRIGQKVDVDYVKSMEPDAVVIATGATPIIPPVPGADSPYVHQAHSVLKGEVKTGETVLIIGGGSVGCETADYLSQMGKKVTIVEMLDELARDVEQTVKYFLIKRLKEKGVVMITGATVTEVRPDGAMAVKNGRPEAFLGFDSVVLAVGVKSDDDLARQLDGAVTELHVIGDARKPGKVDDAILDAEKVAMSV